MSRVLLVLLIIEIGLPLLLYLGRNRLIFFPSSHPSPETGLASLQGSVIVDLVRIERDDGRELAAYDMRPAEWSPGDPVVVFFHGNAGNIGHRASLIERFASGTEARTVLFDYSGYGGNAGSPSEEEVYADGLAVVDYLASSGVASQSLVLYGESLGGAVAAYIASQRPCAGLVLQSSFHSMSSMVRRVYPWLPLTGLLARGSFESAERIAELSIPIVVVHGDRDEVIPYKEGKKLYAAAPEGSRFLSIENAGHNDFFEWAGEDYLRTLGELFHSWALSPSISTAG